MPPRRDFETGLVDFWSYDRFLGYQIPPDYNLLGDLHIQKGAPFVLAGAPGTGKSRAAVALAIAGALGEGASWFGLPVHTRFRTMILQCENGPVRLRGELEDIRLPADIRMDDWLRISLPPPEGFRFDTPEFIAQLSCAIDRFHPHLFILDPWTRLAEDDRQADYRRAFDLLLNALPGGDNGPPWASSPTPASRARTSAPAAAPCSTWSPAPSCSPPPPAPSLSCNTPAMTWRKPAWS